MGSPQAGNVGEEAEPPKPRFLQAIDELEAHYSAMSAADTRPAEELAVALQDMSAGEIQAAAQNFDFVTGATGATIEGDAEGASREAAESLRTAIDGYRGPEEIRQIYQRLYAEPLTEFLGGTGEEVGSGSQPVLS